MFSYFFTNTQLVDRLSSFIEAEHQLLQYAKTRFANSHPSHDEKNHHFTLFDTPINIPSVIKDDAMNCQVHDTDESSDKYSLHGVKVINKQLESSASIDKPAPLVLLHGYANGSLYFYRNLMGLSSHFSSVYALDMLGWGRSSRPKFELLTSNISNDEDSIGNEDSSNIDSITKQQVSTAESFFVESLESWRKHHNLPKLTLAGHSMGGYLSVAYAEKYPQHVEKLILLSPVGVPEKTPQDMNRINTLPFYVRYMIKTARFLFDKGITPGAFLRSLPSSRSKALVDGYVLNRLPAITCQDERKHLSEYLYQNSMLPGSGECCLNEILTSGAFAKIPLLYRIPHLKQADGKEMEVHMIYGQNDWMSYRGGLDTQILCHKKRMEWEEEEQTNGNSSSSSPPPRVSVYGVKNASHLLMLDNYEEFNAALIIAAGGGEKTNEQSPHVPVEFACDELLTDGSGSLNRSSSSGRKVAGESEAAAFFRGGFRRFRKDEDDDNAAEEKKMEE